MQKIQEEELLRRRQAELEIAKQEQERQRFLMEQEIKQKEEKRRLELLELQRQQQAAKLREEAEKAAAERFQQQAELERQKAQQLAQQKAQLLAQQQQLAQQKAQELAQQKAQQLAQQQKVLATSIKSAPWSSNQSKTATNFDQIQEQERLEALKRKEVDEQKRREFESQRKASTPQVKLFLKFFLLNQSFFRTMVILGMLLKTRPNLFLFHLPKKVNLNKRRRLKLLQNQHR